MTFGHAAAARVRLDCFVQAVRHQVEPDPAEHARRSAVEGWLPLSCRPSA